MKQAGDYEALDMGEEPEGGGGYRTCTTLLTEKSGGFSRYCPERSSLEPLLRAQLTSEESESLICPGVHGPS